MPPSKEDIILPLWIALLKDVCTSVDMSDEEFDRRFAEVEKLEAEFNKETNE